MKRSGFLILFIVCIFISCASLYQVFRYMAGLPQGSIFPLVHNYEQDYYWYLSLMRQGWDGTLFVTSRYSPEIFPPQFVNTFFPFFGLVARIFHLSLPVMYTVLRVVFGTGLLYISYMLLKALRFQKFLRILGFFLIIFSTPLWFIEKGLLKQAGEFWTGFDPIFRITWLPHHVAANICLIGALLFFSKSRQECRSCKHLIISGIIGALCGFINPGASLTLFLAAGIGSILDVIQARNKRVEFVVSAGIFFGIASVPLFWLFYVQNTVFPWTAFRDWERFVQYPVDLTGLFGILGLTGLIGLIGIPFAFEKKDMLWNSIIGWIIAPFIGIGLLTHVLPVSNSRFLQTAWYIPAAALSVLVISRFQRFGKFVVPLIACIICLVQVPSFVASIVRQEYYVTKNTYNPMIYINKDLWNAMEWLSEYGEKDAVIMAPVSVSTMLPAFTSLRVIAGHPTFTMQSEIKQRDISMFYQMAFSDMTILTSYGVSYVWQDHELPIDSPVFSRYRQVYENNSISILKRI